QALVRRRVSSTARACCAIHTCLKAEQAPGRWHGNAQSSKICPEYPLVMDKLGEIILRVEGRRKCTAGQKVKILTEVLKPGATVSAYASRPAEELRFRQRHRADHRGDPEVEPDAGCRLALHASAERLY